MPPTPTKLIFCSSLEKLTNANLVGNNTWKLYRVVRPQEDQHGYDPEFLLRDYGNGILTENIAFELNSRNCFDFEYVAEKYDRFEMDNGLKGKKRDSFSLIYKEDKWEVAQYFEYMYAIEVEIATGKVKELPLPYEEIISHYKRVIGHIEVEKILPIVHEKLNLKIEFLDFCNMIKEKDKDIPGDKDELAIQFLDGIFNGGELRLFAEEAIKRNLKYQKFEEEWSRPSRLFINHKYSKKELFQIYLDMKLWENTLNSSSVLG